MIDAEEMGLMRLGNVSPEELRRNEELLRQTKNRLGGPPAVITWFLPYVDHALKGGVRTVFMTAEYMSMVFGTANHFVIVGYGTAYPDTDQLAASLRQHFAGMKFTIQPFRTLFDDPDLIPTADCAICTLWTTAYVSVRYQKVRAKFYLVQDFEPLFYPAGSVSAIIEHTYRFGFALIANTRGVAAPLGRYTKDVTQFCPGVDRKIFRPDDSRDQPHKPFRIVFYGRPGNQRNCFALGIETLRAVKRKLGENVNIVSAGAEWDEEEESCDGVVKNLGLLSSMEEVAQLYRDSDLGLVFMTTPHPSYQPFEYMASGCVVASNWNEATSWLLNHDNALILKPLPEVAAQQIAELYSQPKVWQQKRLQGVSDIAAMDWPHALGKIAERLTK